MGIFDFLRDWFPVPRHTERLGPNDLPSDIINDLRANQTVDSDNQADGYSHDYDEQPLSSLHNDRFHGCRGEYGHRPGHEIEDSLKLMDHMLNGLFGGVFRGELGDGHVEKDEPKSLREKMLDSDDSVDEMDSDMLSFHFNHDVESPNESPFSFHTPLFKQFFGFGNEFPFGNLEESPFGRMHRDMELPFDRSTIEHDSPTIDKDLDNNLDESDIGDLLSSHKSRESQDISFRSPNSQGTASSSTFKYSTFSRKMNADGSVETTSTKRDSNGNEEVTVTRNIGEQTHSVITKKSKDGNEEKVENFVNMEKDDLQEFEGKWMGSSDGHPQNGMMGPGNLRDFNDAFSSWWKPRL